MARSASWEYAHPGETWTAPAHLLSLVTLARKGVNTPPSGVICPWHAVANAWAGNLVFGSERCGWCLGPPYASCRTRRPTWRRIHLVLVIRYLAKRCKNTYFPQLTWRPAWGIIRVRLVVRPDSIGRVGGVPGGLGDGCHVAQTHVIICRCFASSAQFRPPRSHRRKWTNVDRPSHRRRNRYALCANEEDKGGRRGTQHEPYL